MRPLRSSPAVCSARLLALTSLALAGLALGACTVSTSVEETPTPAAIDAGTGSTSGGADAGAATTFTCAAGAVLAQDGGVAICSACPTGTFSAAADASECRPWTVCPVGQKEVIAPTGTSDRQCLACPTGQTTAGENDDACAVLPLQIAVGAYHTCALASDGAVRCWGLGASQALGNGTTGNAPTPVTVLDVSGATQIAVGVSHGCAVLADGTVRCWGSDLYGQLGDGRSGTGIFSTAVTVTGLTNAKAVALGAGHSCALLGDGTVRCWGLGTSGQLGGPTNTSSTSPVAVTGLTDAVELDSFNNATCARRADGSVRCWGQNTSGQLGDGSVTSSVSIAVGSLHACAALRDGTVRCWGWNASGQLGDGTADHDSHPAPVVVSGITTARSVAAGAATTCAILADGTARCWGNDVSGQLGDGNDDASSTPVVVQNLEGVRAIDTGAVSTCALLPKGELRCWGQNGAGAVGDGTFLDRATPVPVVW